MNKWTLYLGIFLIAQIALAVGTNIARTDYGAFEPTETLLSFDGKAIDSIVIEENKDQQVSLSKKDGNWLVSQMHNFHADQDKVENFLEKLSGMKKGWPVASTAAAAKRFKVSENEFERKITLSKKGEQDGLLFIGTSPSFRKVHARSSDENAIFTVEFNDYEASVKPEDWIDKDVLKHPAAEIAKVELPDVSLSNQEGKLVVEGVSEEEETVVEEADRLLRKLTDLRISKVLGAEEKDEYNLDAPILKYSLTLSSGEAEQYVYSKQKDANNYVLKPSHRKEYFEVAGWIVDDIKEFNRSKLVKKKAVDTTDNAEKQDGPDAS